MALINCRFYSKYLAHQTEVNIMLPERDKNVPKGGYPLVYLLHGRGDDATSYLRNSSVERYVNEHCMAAVMPNAETSFYMDGVYGKRFFSFLTKELPEAVQDWFPVTKDPDKTFVAGLSMGGYGALRAGLTFPEKYRKIAIMSAATRIDLMPDFEATEEGNEILHDDIRRAFGDRASAPENVPSEMIRRLMAENRRVPSILHYEGRQDILYDMNVSFRDFALRNHLDYKYEEWDGEHDWIFWEEALRRMFIEFSNRPLG